MSSLSIEVVIVHIVVVPMVIIRTPMVVVNYDDCDRGS